MKKLSQSLLVVLLALSLVFAFAACGSQEAATDDGSADTAAEGEAPELQMEIAQADWDSYRQKIELPTGITMAYVEMGTEDGDPLVLIHGMTDNSRAWSLIAPYFTEAGYHVYMIDLRGHGETDKPVDTFYTIDDFAEDVAAFMDAKGIEKADIIGHSLGSMTAQAFELLYPEKCDHVIWESTAPVTVTSLGTDFYEYGISLGADGTPDDEFMAGWYENPNPVDEEFLKYEMEESQVLTGDVWECIAGGEAMSNMVPLYPYLDDSIPTLILWGSVDGFFNEDFQNELKGYVPFAKFIAYEGNGHNLQWEIPEQMAKDCIAFFNDEEVGE